MGYGSCVREPAEQVQVEFKPTNTPSHAHKKKKKKREKCTMFIRLFVTVTKYILREEGLFWLMDSVVL